MKITYRILPVLAVALLLPACNETKNESANPTAEGAASQLDSLYSDVAPADAKEISEILKDPTPGKEIVVSGEIMGRSSPFVDGRAMVLLGDPTKITPCNRIPGDECPTPWDNCCDDPEVLKKSIATVQFLDEDGKILKNGLKGYKGIKELSFLTVKGTIAEGSNANNLLINGLAFHVTEPSPYLNAPPAADYSHHGHLDGEIEEDADGTFIYKKPEDPAKTE
ncbi:MAG: hypothetical protein P1V20_21905 [Verrucomicrobiales bacterium]|nr:hypothetical protein [Verrucomicrobiales bacterium]